MTSPGQSPRKRVNAAEVGARSGRGAKPESGAKKAANSAVRKGAAAAATAATGGVGAPVVAAATSLIGTDESAKRRRRLIFGGIAAVIIFLVSLLAMMIAMAMGTSLMGAGSGTTERPLNGECLSITAPRVTADGGGAGSSSTAAAGSLGAPLDEKYMESSSGFGGREAPTAGATSWHDGIDFSGPDILHKPIYAVADGVVEQAGPADGYGNWVLLNHTIEGKPVTTLYGHIDDGHLKVKKGDRVKAGQHIADVGNSGFSTGPHLHFGVYPGGWKSQAGVDPMPWLSKFKAAAPAEGSDNGSRPAEQVADTGGSSAGPSDQVNESDWDKLAHLESTGNWKINSGNGYYGGLQFTKSTWEGNGGGRFAPMPHEATKNEQMEVANQVLKTQGWGAWPPSQAAGIRGKKPAPAGTFAGGAGADGGRGTTTGGAAGELPKSDKGDERNLQAAAQRGMRLVAAKFPQVKNIGGYRGGGGAMDHGTGAAIDAMIEDYSSPAGIALGDKVAQFFIDNAGELDVKYVIWRNRIWQNGSWSGYGSSGDDNDKHNNHVHVSFNSSGPPTATVVGLAGVAAGDSEDTSVDDAPEGAQPYEPQGEQKSQELSPEQQANIKAMISSARRSGIEPAARAAVLAIAYSGTQANFISRKPTAEDPATGIFAEVPLEGADTGDMSNLINPPYAANRFYARLKEVSDKNPRWATMPLSDVLIAMFPEQRTRGPEFGSWEKLAIGSVTAMWDDPYARASAVMEMVNADVECLQGNSTGAALKPGSVPERFFKWISLAGQICEGMTAPLLAAQIEQESGFNEQATSGVGAMGSSQFMPGTWPTWGKKVDDNGNAIGPGGSGDPRLASDATMAQGHMMCADYEAIVKLIADGKVKGDPVALTLAAYNAGLGAVISAGGMPSGGDYTVQTQPYVQKIMAAAAKFAADDGGLVGTPGKFVFYSQNDRQWNESGLDMAMSGCGPTSIAMAISTVTGKKVTPLDVAQYAMSTNDWYSGGALQHAIFAKLGSKYGVKVTEVGGDYEKAKAALKAGKPMVVAGEGPAPFTGSGHVVAARGVTPDGKIIIANPANITSGVGTAEASPYSTPLSGFMNMWIFERASK